MQQVNVTKVNMGPNIVGNKTLINTTDMTCNSKTDNVYLT